MVKLSKAEKGENYPLTIGSGTLIPGFEEQLIGAEPGKEVEAKKGYIPGRLPCRRPQRKKMLYSNVQYMRSSKKELPELDDEFASEVSEFDTS